MIKRIILNGVSVEYDLQRKNVKNLNLRIKSDMTVHVSANRFTSQKAIDNFLISKASYIINSLKRFEEKNKFIQKPFCFNNSDTLSFLGNKRFLRLTEGKNQVSVDEEYINLSVISTDNLQLKKSVLSEWYKQECFEIVTSLCQKIHPEFEHFGVRYPQIKFRSMTSRWGSCQPMRGILTFNSFLVTAPIECIVYVVYHEFTHFLQPDHSKRFYALLESFLPDWKERKALLDQYGADIKKYKNR